MPQFFKKDPSAILDYVVDWGRPGWLITGDVIDTSDFTCTVAVGGPPEGITLQSDSHDDTTATVWLAGGTAGVTYQVVNHITTTPGNREDDRTLYIKCMER